MKAAFATDGAPMNTDDRRFDDLTYRIIGCAHLQIHNELGHGYLEKLYEVCDRSSS